MSRFSSTRAGVYIQVQPSVYFWNAIKTLVLFLASAREKKNPHKGISLERFVQNIKCALKLSPVPLNTPQLFSHHYSELF